MKKQFNDYYIGLDIGTNSVGWAASDEEYNLLKMNKKDFWGARLFETANSAEERRLHRGEKRRNQRRKTRIKLLNELFSEEISKIDFSFYQRLKESRLHAEDRFNNKKNQLFSGGNINDEIYNKKYPTIYHLRKAIIDDSYEDDIRLVYLAIHHILKHRGNFIFEGQNFDSVSSLDLSIKDLIDIISNCENISLDFSIIDVNRFEEILLNTELSKRDKTKEITNLFGKVNKSDKEVFKALLGSKFSLDILFEDESLSNDDNNKISFNEGYEDKEDDIRSSLEERYDLVEKIKSIYDWSVLKSIMSATDSNYISDARVAVYEKHKHDLIFLKQLVKKTDGVSYNEIFKLDVKNNYVAYTGHSSNLTNVKPKKVNSEEFYKFLKSKFKKYEKSNYPDYIYLFSEIDKKTFLPKQVNSDNGVIPYQIHEIELKAILNNAARKFSFLNKKDDNGITVADKILAIFTFRIPYYVGPLNSHSKFSWLKKNSDEKIYPWNFTKIVDDKASAENFITRMTNTCSYLVGEDVLPKNSLIYTEYLVLNELNNLRINGEYLKVAYKQAIFNDLYKNYKKVTVKRLKKYLINQGIMTSDDNLSGFDTELVANYKPYLDFKSVIGDKVTNTKMIEDIIRWSTIFSDSKKMLKNKIIENYSTVLSEEEINRVSKLKYSGWGRFSYKLLAEITDVDSDTGEVLSIINALRNTQHNFMQLLANDKNYLAKINEHNKKLDKDKDLNEVIDELYVSPAVKRSINQSVRILLELKKIIKKDPLKIMIETTRSEQEKVRTSSRKNRLIQLYKQCKDESRDWVKELESRDEASYRKDLLYLYYTQMGRCMYSGNKIDLDNLFNKNLYDIDHIYPQSKTKDDSISNRVLVEKRINAEKKDEYPINSNIQKRQKSFWSMLLAKDLISKKKYDRLVRSSELTDEELANFIARQIVETSQATKAVTKLAKLIFPSSTIVFVKARNVSDFRHNFDFVKVRELNDFHHAHDAYLNIVVGNVFDTKFTQNPMNYIKKIKEKNEEKYNLKRMYDFNVIRNGKYAWKTGKNNTFATVYKMMNKDSCLITRLATEGKGTLFDVNILKAGKGQVPIKGNNPSSIEKYGGYNKVKGAYFALVESKNKKGEIVKSIEFVSIMRKNFYESSDENKLIYFREIGLIQPRILIPKIRINQLFKIDGFKFTLSGRTNDRLLIRNANQLKIKKNYQHYIKSIVKVANKINEAKRNKLEYKVNEYDRIDIEKNIELYRLFSNKLTDTLYSIKFKNIGNKLKLNENKFVENAIENQCIILLEVIHLLQCNPLAADLTLLIGSGKKTGVLLISKKIDSKSKLSMINQSVTGIFENEIQIS